VGAVRTRVAVVGAGTIGASWVATFLHRGCDVVVSDPAPNAEAFVRAFVDGVWGTLAARGDAAPGASPDRLVFVGDPAAAVANADFVQESGPEREAVKVELLDAVAAATPPEVVIASSSSGLLASRLQCALRHPERFVIGHPFNPPHLIPLVEVVGGSLTSPAAIERAMDFYRAMGKRPIHIRREVKGHVANRLQAALWREAVSLVADGVASVADVDAAIAHGPGLRWAFMGPHLTFALAGGEGGMPHFLDHIGGPMQEWWDDLGSPTLTPEVRQAIIDGVAEEAGDRTIADLQRERDRLLLAVLAAVGRPVGVA
jgi:carnitine 3-dehydrogenase